MARFQVWPDVEPVASDATIPRFDTLDGAERAARRMLEDRPGRPLVVTLDGGADVLRLSVDPFGRVVLDAIQADLVSLV